MHNIDFVCFCLFCRKVRYVDINVHASYALNVNQNDFLLKYE